VLISYLDVHICWDFQLFPRKIEPLLIKKQNVRIENGKVVIYLCVGDKKYISAT